MHKKFAPLVHSVIVKMSRGYSETTVTTCMSFACIHTVIVGVCVCVCVHDHSVSA